MANQLAADDVKKILQSIGNDVSEIKEMVSYHTALAVAEEAAAKTAANAAAAAAAAKAAAALAALAAAAKAAKAAANAGEPVEFEINGQTYIMLEDGYLYENDRYGYLEYVGKYNNLAGTINNTVPEHTYEGGRRRKRKTRKGKKRSYRKRTRK